MKLLVRGYETTAIEHAIVFYVTIVATFRNPDEPDAGPATALRELYVAPGDPHHINGQNPDTLYMTFSGNARWSDLSVLPSQVCNYYHRETENDKAFSGIGPDDFARRNNGTAMYLTNNLMVITTTGHDGTTTTTRKKIGVQR
ncbi:MAG: hypothetical protein GF350_14150 [Chitinivibrionales bacterium]|nr:hypothetical protein [Chitinivibrionales bacterium]